MTETKTTWQRLAPSSSSDDEEALLAHPGPRSSHALAYVAPYVYLLAGELTPRVPVDDSGAVWRLDLSADQDKRTWQRVETTTSDDENGRPPPCIAPTAVAIANTIYLFGGRTAIDMKCGTLGDVYALDTTTHRWAKVWSQPPQAMQGGGDNDGDGTASGPCPRSYHASCALNNRFFVFGGCGPSGRLNDLWAFDPTNRSWERMPDPPASVAPRGGASLASLPLKNTLVLVGGFDGEHERADAHAFDAGKGAWCSGAEGCASCAGEAPTLPARSVLGAAAHTGCLPPSSCAAPPSSSSSCGHAGHIVAFGGECDPSVTRSHDTAGRFMADVWCGDLSRGCSWHPLSTAAAAEGSKDESGPGPRGWFASCAVPGGLAVHGGLDASNARLSDSWLLRFGH